MRRRTQPFPETFRPAIRSRSSPRPRRSRSIRRAAGSIRARRQPESLRRELPGARLGRGRHPAAGDRGRDPSAAAAIRRTLAGAGVSGQIALRSYAPPPHVSAPPIRVAFMSLEARVATPCGNWPEDLASGSSLEGWKNEPYANLGCASQSVLAAEVADPRDFVEPRALGARRRQHAHAGDRSRARRQGPGHGLEDRPRRRSARTSTRAVQAAEAVDDDACEHVPRPRPDRPGAARLDSGLLRIRRRLPRSSRMRPPTAAWRRRRSGRP